MKQIALSTILLLTTLVGGAEAGELGRFDLNTGVGFAVDSSANTTFSFSAGAGYFFTEHFGVGPFFDLFTADGITTLVDAHQGGSDSCTILPCVSTRYDKVTLDTGGQMTFSAGSFGGPTFLASAGAGYIRVLGSQDGVAFPLSIGAYLTFGGENGTLYGVGTLMTWEITTLDTTHLIWNWRVLSLDVRF